MHKLNLLQYIRGRITFIPDYSATVISSQLTEVPNFVKINCLSEFSAVCQKYVSVDQRIPSNLAVKLASA